MCNVKVNENEHPPHIHTHAHIYNHSTQFIRTPEYSIQDVKQMILCNIKWKKKKTEKIKPKEERREKSVIFWYTKISSFILILFRILYCILQRQAVHIVAEYKKKIALFVTKNVTINLFECKHMK